MQILNLFNKKKKNKKLREIAPQLTIFERRKFAEAAVPPGTLPYPTYEEMERDSMIQTCLTLKKLGVLSAETRVVPADDSPEAATRAAFVEETFARMEGSPRTILLQAMDAFVKGWSVQEAVYEEREGRVWLVAMRPKDPALFGLDADAFGRIQGLTLQIPGEPPRELPRSKFVVFANRGGYGRLKGRSDLDAAYSHWRARSSLLAAWKFHLERFAMPTLLGKFDPALAVEEQDALAHKLEDVHNRTAITFPNQIEIDSLGGSKEPSGGYMEAIEFHNREIARAILGQTLTTDEGRRVGSLALGKVHLQVLLVQLEALRRELADVVLTEQVIRPLVEMNFGPGLVPRFEFMPARLSAFASGSIG